MARKKNRNSQHNARRTAEALRQRQMRVFAAWSQGEPQHAIATREGVHPGQITRDLDAVLGELHERDLDKADENRRRLLGEIAWQKQELRAAWERSKKPKDRKKARLTEGLGRNGKGERRDAETVTEGRDGNPKFLGELRALEELESRLLGIAATKHEHTGPNGGPIQHTVLTDEQRAAALARLYAAVGRSHRVEHPPGEAGQPGGTVPGGPERDSL